jgi:hypothetical protein
MGQPLGQTLAGAVAVGEADNVSHRAARPKRVTSVVALTVTD